MNLLLDSHALLSALHAPGQMRPAALAGQASARLPWIHADPFDRVLIAQAQEHGLQIATRDAVFGSYGVPVLEV